MNIRYPSKWDELLTELTHLLSHGDELEHGMNINEVRKWLMKPIPHKNGRNALKCLEDEGPKFIDEVRIYLNS